MTKQPPKYPDDGEPWSGERAEARVREADQQVAAVSKSTRLKEIAYFDPQQDSGTWSAYPYTGPLFRTGLGIPIYACDGVENNALAEGMVVYRAILPKPGRHIVDHLNPQTLD